ncbi:MAG: DGQHR domain-containing protein [Alphaproteobacteria bacterium]|nr:DGQHR domain-containing protein [Alphaproteobacteria bacterium]
MASELLTRRALQLRQHDEHPVFVFALRPDEVLRIANISRISRDNDGTLIGYQRDEVKRHVKDILDYLNSGQVLFPNAIILSFNESVRFRRSRGPATDDGLATSGSLDIPLVDEGQARPAWIVDGQQRALALSRTKNKDLAVPVVAFLGNRVDVQRDQFLRVNNTRPLKLSLITELLPEVDTTLPRRMSVRRLPSAICELLSSNPDSPFQGFIKRPSIRGEPAKRAVITDTSLVEMVRQRLKSPSGCLFPYHNMATGETDTDAVLKLLLDYWRAVRDTFPEAWGLPTSRSRLMHGVGLKSMGNLMDAIMSRVDPFQEDGYAHAMDELQRVAPICRWTSGHWEGLNGLHWKELENTPRSVKLLTNHLLREYHLSAKRG